MTAEQFTYWLNGFIELNGHVPNPEQWESIKKHLSTVFMKITPVMPPFNPPVYAPGPVVPLEEPQYYPPFDGCRPIPSWQPNRDIAIC
jgi:hypothetical protein